MHKYKTHKIIATSGIFNLTCCNGMSNGTSSFYTKKMSGAMPPLPHVPLWCEQAYHYLFT